MVANSGFYAIYDEESQGVKLVDEQGFEQVKERVTSGKPNIDGIDYEKCREIMRFKPFVVRRRPVAPPLPTDLVVVYEPSNQSVIAITRADYEKNKSKYDQGPAPTLKAQPAAPKPAPTLTPAFTDASPTEKKKPAPEPKPAQAPSTDDVRSFKSLIFQPPKIGLVELSPDDLVAVYDPATQSVIAVKRSQYESGTTAATPKPAVAAQKTSDLIFQAPKVGPIKLCPDDLLAVYHPESQGVILVTRKQYDQSDITAATPKPAVAAQKTSDLIFQAPKVGPIKLCPDDLLAVYHPKTQGVILVTRKQYDQGDITTAAKIPIEAEPAQAQAAKHAAAPTPSAPQQTANLIYQPPKIGPIKLSPNDLLAVYQPESQGVILVTRKQYDAGEIPAATPTAKATAAPQSFKSLIFQPPKVGPITLCPNDLLAVYQPESQGVILVTRKQYDAGEIPTATSAATAAPQSFKSLIFQPPKVGPITLCPNDLLAVYQPESQEVVLVTRKQYDAGEIPPVARQSFTNLIFQPPKVGPIVLEDDDLIAIYEPETQSVTTVTRKEFNKL